MAIKDLWSPIRGLCQPPGRILTLSPHRLSSVLIVLAPPAGVKNPGLEDLLVYFEKRAAHIPQGGEICLPGGGRDPNETSEAAALREWEEETGIPASTLEILGCFGTLVHLASRSIDVWIAKGPDPRSVHPAPNEEVDLLFTTSLGELMRCRWESYEMEFDVRPGVDVPVAPTITSRPAQHFPLWFVYGLPELLWGMTAGILRQFLFQVFGRYPGEPRN